MFNSVMNRDYFCVNTFSSCSALNPPSFPGSECLNHILGRFITSQSALVLKYYSTSNCNAYLYPPDQQLCLVLEGPAGEEEWFSPTPILARCGMYGVRVGIMIWISHSLFKISDL